MMQASPNHDFFATTRWTLVLDAGQSGTPQAAEALEVLCQSYWFPLYAYVRRRGHGKEDAEDLTQAFFADLLVRRDLAGTESGKGKFRAFLLACLKNFLANERDKSQRLKRGGSITHLSLDWQSADSQFQIADVTQAAPDAAFDREWAMTLLERVVVRLRDEWEAEGKLERFERMRVFLTAGKGEIPFAMAAGEMGMDEGSLRVAVHRMRKRYRELLRKEVADTLLDPAMVREELAVLVTAFG